MSDKPTSRRRRAAAQDVPQGAAEPAQTEQDLSAYYSREGAGEAGAEPSFAPPIKLDSREPEQDAAQSPVWEGNVYHPREATWADTQRREILSGDVSYQVRDEGVIGKRRVFPWILSAIAALVLLAGAAYLFRDDLSGLLGRLSASPEPSGQLFSAVTTPAPIRGYDEAPAASVSDAARVAITQISGTVEMEIRAVTDAHILTRNLRPDGTYDFYLFTAAEGRLVSYFEGLDAQGMIPQADGCFYVRQAPYLIAPNGSALLRTADIENLIGDTVTLFPLQHGWAVVRGDQSGASNFVNANGQLLSTLWFTRVFPFTGDATLAYVDTGSTAAEDERYLLYVVGSDGTMNRWQASASTQDVVASACGMAYLQSGDLYRLPDTSAPLINSDSVEAYLDCDAVVVRDPVTGKYGLFVHGEQHYDFAYDSIGPVPSDIVWAREECQGANGALGINAVAGADYPQPLSHYFVLEKDGQVEYVALSTNSAYPIALYPEH